MVRSAIAWFCILFFPAEPAPSQTAADAAEALPLDRCISLSVAHNPLWLSSEGDYQASLARVRQAKAIPQPSLEFDSDLQPNILDFRNSGESYFGVSQTVEFPGKGTLRGKIAALESGEVLDDRDLLRLDMVRSEERRVGE